MNSSMTKYRAISFTLLLNVLSVAAILAQMPEPEVRKRLDFIYNGQAERVRIELPTLQRQYPDDPGVDYLDAILTTDGVAAVKKYQAIVDQFPQNEWADDALYKVYQYYYSVGLYKTADQKFEQLKQQYPNSLYVVGLAQEQKPVSVEKHPPVETNKPEIVETKPSEQPATVEAPKAEASDPTVAAAPVGKFAVQAGAYSAEKNAQKQVDFFATIGKKAIIGTRLSSGKTLYLVSVEGFSNEQDARSFIAELKSKYNIESIIVAR
jgi:tetratricopeptide (TPR) repeat protein